MKPTPMISLPTKGMVDGDWIGPLRHYVASVYGPGDHFVQEINSLHRLRQDVRGSASDTIGRDLIYRYYGQLELLDLRIPVNERGCRMAFSWRDSFTQDSTTQYSLAFEKASLLFNLATVNCNIGAETEDVKLAYRSFQAAAGIYNYVMENFLHAPSTDLSQETVKALSKLMLAQAQESFLDKMLESGSKASMVAKVAKAASVFYKTAAENLQQVHTNKAWGDKSWYQYSFLKSAYFMGLACEYQSESSEASGKFGDAVAYAQCAVNSYQECAKMPTPAGFTAINQAIKTRNEAIKHRIQALQKDNDYIYHAIVPPIATLAEIGLMEAAKPTPMNELYKDQKDVSQIIGGDIFENLIPLAVHEKSSMYSEEKANLLRNEGEKVEVADEELSSALEFLDLPGSLRLVKNGGRESDDVVDVPAIVKDWATEMSSGTGKNSVRRLEDIEKKRAAVYEKVKMAEQKIENEQKETEHMKQQYGDRWTQASALTMSSGILSDIQQVKQSLSSGTSSDAKVKQMLDASRDDIRVLSGGPGSLELEALFKFQSNSSAQQQQNLLDLDQSDDENVKQWISEAENMLSTLRKISKERKNIFSEFKDKVHKDDISSLLILNAKVPNLEDQLFKTELAKFEPYQARLDSTVHHQKQLLKDLTAVWKKVLSNDSVKRQTSSREAEIAQRSALFERLRKAFNSWKDAQDGLAKGDQFYTELDATASSIAANTEQFVVNRREERAKMSSSSGGSISASQLSEERLRSQLSELSMDHSGSNIRQYASPPPPPPPPQQQQQPISASSSYGQNVQNSAWGNLGVLEQPTPPPKPPKPHMQSQPQPPHLQSQPQPPHVHPQPQYGQSHGGGGGGYGTPSMYDSSLYSRPPQGSPYGQASAPSPPTAPQYQPQYSYQTQSQQYNHQAPGQHAPPSQYPQQGGPPPAQNNQWWT